MGTKITSGDKAATARQRSWYRASTAKVTGFSAPGAPVRQLSSSPCSKRVRPANSKARRNTRAWNLCSASGESPAPTSPRAASAPCRVPATWAAHGGGTCRRISRLRSRQPRRSLWVETNSAWTWRSLHSARLRPREAEPSQARSEGSANRRPASVGGPSWLRPWGHQRIPPKAHRAGQTAALPGLRGRLQGAHRRLDAVFS